MDKHEAMLSFVKPKIMQLCDELRFNISPEEADSFAFIPDYSSKVLKHFIRSARREYRFAVIITKPYSAELDDLNLESMKFAQGFMDWIESNNKQRSYPEFPDNCNCERWEVLQNMPNLSGINVEIGLAQYTVQARLIYKEDL